MHSLPEEEVKSMFRLALYFTFLIYLQNNADVLLVQWTSVGAPERTAGQLPLT